MNILTKRHIGNDKWISVVIVKSLCRIDRSYNYNLSR